jgi:hypothetical protein
MPVVQHPEDSFAALITQWGDMLPRALGDPPIDVRDMLARHGCALPLYLDVQRLRHLARARSRWPTLHAHLGPTVELAQLGPTAEQANLGSTVEPA